MARLLKGSIALATFLLSACVQPKYANVTMKPDEIINNKMGMVMAKVNIPYRDLFNRQGNYNGYAELGNLENEGKEKIYLVDGSSYVNSATMIRPGTYSILSLGWNDGLYVYEIKFRPRKLQLDILPGNCFYLGDFSITRKNDRDLILIKNNISAATDSIQNSKLNPLAKKLQFFTPIQGDTITVLHH